MAPWMMATCSCPVRCNRNGNEHHLKQCWHHDKTEPKLQFGYHAFTGPGQLSTSIRSVSRKLWQNPMAGSRFQVVTQRWLDQPSAPKQLSRLTWETHQVSPRPSHHVLVQNRSTSHLVGLLPLLQRLLKSCNVRSIRLVHVVCLGRWKLTQDYWEVDVSTGTLVYEPLGP